ncbi:hypothetical protein Cpir12675_006587 [Ceratocystis pirilliformis]|uniref:2-dehydropantoate 2-reductase n=1 Tax=Ceratocystis pirilliformis TaxID=259994 RepID=A0ABR3YHU0_9PEZI
MGATVRNEDAGDLMRFCVVGGNAVSAFLSWRLQATNATDVTLVWKAGFEHVSQYGISFKSSTFNNERFKPRTVVRSPEEASTKAKAAPFDYVILCVKALPDIYDLASVIESVVTPQHTCIIVNTTSTLGVESALEERFPTNIVLSLVSLADIVQLGQSEFEHRGGLDIWVGPANKNSSISPAVQDDMAQALAMTLSTGQVNCKVAPNIQQFQFERVVGPAAFHPASVIFETSNHTQLLEKVGVKDLVHGIIDEMIQIANAHGCSFAPDFKQSVISDMTSSSTESIMWQDFVAHRPMEVETFLGSPIKLAAEAGVPVPRISTVYAIMHNLNTVNRQGLPKVSINGANPTGPAGMNPQTRMSGAAGRGLMVNGNGMRPQQGRPRNGPGVQSMGPPPSMMPGGRRPPNGFRGPMGPSSRAQSRRGSMDGDLDEFAHLTLYEEGMDASIAEGPDSIDLRTRELQLRQRELALREQEMRMRRSAGGPNTRRSGNLRNSAHIVDDDDDDDDYVDPTSLPPMPMVDPDSVDMMSLTSRRIRKTLPSQSSIRRNPEADVAAGQSRGSRFRFNRGRTSASQIASIPVLGENILDDPLMAYSSNRYGNVDRGTMAASSRANSLTASHMQEYQINGRRTSNSPGTAYTASVRGMPPSRPSPPNGYPGPQMNGRPSPPNGMMQPPVPRYPPGSANGVGPQHIEQQVGVSISSNPKISSMTPSHYSTLKPNQQSLAIRSVTGSPSASGLSGESGASANSSQSSLGPRALAH